MNIKVPFTQLRITTKPDLEQVIETAVPDGLGEAVLLAKLHIHNIARKQVSVMNAIAEHANGIAKLILGVSIPHQMGYMLSKAPTDMSLDSPTHIVAVLSVFAAALALPIGLDLLILLCIKLIAAPAAATWKRFTAFGLMMFPVAGSMRLNFLAPGPHELQMVFALMILIVPISQVIRWLAEDPDFPKLKKLEERIAEQLHLPTMTAADVTLPGRPHRKPCAHELQARQESNYGRLKQANKQKWTADWRAKHFCPDNVDELLKMQNPNAPTSGQPVNA